MTAPTVTLTLTPFGLQMADGKPKVITCIDCRFIAARDDQTAELLEGVQIGMPDPDPENYIPADQVTADILLGWVQAAKGADFDFWRAEKEAAVLAMLSPPATFVGETLQV